MLITVCFVDTCVCALRQHVHSLFLVQAEEPLGASSVAKVPSKSPSASSASESESQQVWQRPCVCYVVLCCQQSRHKSRQCVLCRYVLCRWFTLLQEQLLNAPRGSRSKTLSGPTVAAQSTLKSVAADAGNDQVVNACSKMRAKFIVTFWCRAQNSRLMHQVAALTQAVVFFAVLVLKMLHQ